MTGFTQLTSRTVVLRERNIDTDQIIPARFLTTTQLEGLGRFAFNDWRYLADGRPNPDFALNQHENAVAAILVAGHNFGCGSSSDDAPRALPDFGHRSVVSSQIGATLRSNAPTNGTHPTVANNPSVQTRTP